MRLVEGNAGKEDAEPFGCIANLNLEKIEKFLWRMLLSHDVVMLDQLRMQQVLCALLDEKCILQQGFEPVQTYLTGPQGIDPLKRVQLAGRIARQFMEYEYNRPGVWREHENRWNPLGIDGTWLRGKQYIGDTTDEPWQAELYRMMWKCFNDNTSTDGQYLTLPQLYRLRREKGDADGQPWKVPPGSRFIFGITKISHFHRNLLVEISQMDGVDLHVFLTNPCAEFWEDVRTLRSTPRRSWKNSTPSAAITPRKPEDFDKEELELPFKDQKLLELWGNAGKENIYLWCQDALWNFNYTTPAWADQETYVPATILEALQYSLLRRQTGISTPSSGMKPDRSLQILGCPDPGREIEEIREQILDAVSDGTVSQLNEIVVYLPDTSAYVPFINRVFNRYSPFDKEYIPFCILGTSGKTTHFAQGMTALFALLQGRFDRTHVFELLRNPIVQCTRSIPVDSIVVWENWAEELAIFRGYNRQHRETMGDTGETCTDAHTFELGMARLALAELLEGPVELDFYETSHDGTRIALPVIPYRDFNTSDRANLEQFCSTIETLRSDIGNLRTCAGETGLQETIDTLQELVTDWFGKIPDTPDIDGAVEGSVRKSFLDGIATIPLQSSLVGRDTIPFEEFVSTIAGCLPEDTPMHASAWTGGVTFAPLTPAMVVPHTVVFAGGLDDTAFPGSNQHPSWNLLAKKRIVGDFDQVRANRFAFLELLHAARKRLVLTYRSRNMQKEEELNPSSVLLELESFLTECGLIKVSNTNKKSCAATTTIPWIVHESLQNNLSENRIFGTWNPNEIELAHIASTVERTDRRSLLDTSGNVTAASSATFSTSGYNIREYFKNPLEYHLAQQLGIREQDFAETLLATDEPLASNYLTLMSLYKSVWTSVLRKLFPENPADTVTDPSTLQTLALNEMNHQYTMLTASGCTPEAMIKRFEKENLSGWARRCVNPLQELKAKFEPYRLIEKTDLSLGREGCSATLELSLNNGTRCTVNCSHNLVLVPLGTSSKLPVVILSMKTAGEPKENPDLAIEGTLHRLYSQAENPDLPPPVLVQLNWKKREMKSIGLEESSAVLEQSRDWIKLLLGEMIQQVSDHFPFKIIHKITRNKVRNPQPWATRRSFISRQSIEELLADNYAFNSYNYGLKLTEPRIPDLDDEGLRALADTRFGPVLSELIFKEEVAS